MGAGPGALAGSSFRWTTLPLPHPTLASVAHLLGWGVTLFSAQETPLPLPRGSVSCAASAASHPSLSFLSSSVHPSSSSCEV